MLNYYITSKNPVKNTCPRYLLRVKLDEFFLQILMNVSAPQASVVEVAALILQGVLGTVIIIVTYASSCLMFY